jgi:DNA primase
LKAAGRSPPLLDQEPTSPQSHPTGTPSPRTRKSAPGAIFIDYLRNGRGTTAIGAWSPRARAGFPIAAPVSWRQVEHDIRPDAFTIYNPPRR